MPKSAATWCVKHREGWCATADGRAFPDTQDHVTTRCGSVVTFPYGCERRVPDCTECKEVGK